jgi:hypothetical protein
MIEPRDESPLADELQEKIKVLHDSIWERRADWPQVSRWLNQFREADSETGTDGRLQVLYLLSNFMYFGTNEIRALLKSLYRDVFRASVISRIRKQHPEYGVREVTDSFNEELLRTRFVSLGNPSESSAFLLYYFRQENDLPRECFIGGAEIFSLSDPDQLSVRDPDICHYVFIDDMCGSGSQGEDYSLNTVVPLKAIKEDVAVYYYALFGTAKGIERLRHLARFDEVHPVVELDESFRCFSDTSRFYRNVKSPLERDAALALAARFGAKLKPAHPLGYLDGQLLLGFAYNTPDNTLPIVWSSGTEDFPWTPVFKRYAKLAYS